KGIKEVPTSPRFSCSRINLPFSSYEPITPGANVASFNVYPLKFSGNPPNSGVGPPIGRTYSENINSSALARTHSLSSLLGLPPRSPGCTNLSIQVSVNIPSDRYRIVCETNCPPERQSKVAFKLKFLNRNPVCNPMIKS